MQYDMWSNKQNTYISHRLIFKTNFMFYDCFITLNQNHLESLMNFYLSISFLIVFKTKK